MKLAEKHVAIVVKWVDGNLLVSLARHMAVYGGKYPLCRTDLLLVLQFQYLASLRVSRPVVADGGLAGDRVEKAG